MSCYRKSWFSVLWLTSAICLLAFTSLSAAPIKVGLVTDVGRINDRSFNQSAWEGVKLAKNQLGLKDREIKYIETQDAKDYADNLAQFIEAEYEVIISVGFALGDATIQAAKENPNTLFIGVDQFQGQAMPNLAGLISMKISLVSLLVYWLLE